jgi:hypothetical protein
MPIHRIAPTLTAPIVLAVGLVLHPAAQAPDTAAILKAAGDAIGGDARVRAVKSLRLRGTTFSTQSVRGGYTYDSEEPLELRFALPDRYLELTANVTTSRVTEMRKGFVGDRLISWMGERETNPPGQLTYLRKKAAEYLMVLLARTESWGGLTFEATVPNVVQVKGLDGYAVRLDFDPSTHRLTKLTYWQRRQVRPRNTIARRAEIEQRRRQSGGRIGGAGAGASADLPEVEIAITFHDHREIDGILLPHRITTTAVAEQALLWELRFATIEVNPALGDEDFRLFHP